MFERVKAPRCHLFACERDLREENLRETFTRDSRVNKKKNIQKEGDTLGTIKMGKQGPIRLCTRIAENPAHCNERKNTLL